MDQLTKDIRNVCDTSPRFSMFTKQGDIAVASIVNLARFAKLSWPETYALLVRLADSDTDKYGEATDTAVRECVYDALGFDTPFYI